MFSLLIIAFLGAASADLLYEGQCPDVAPVENFDMQAYEGTWYEVAMLPLYNQMNGKCSTSVYTVEGDGLSVRNSHIVNGVKQYLDGNVKHADQSKSGKLIQSFKIAHRVKVVEPYILAIDYQNYAIAYSCRYDESKKSHYSK
ncbi:hypothetical protein O3G_MSEX009140 [Manduca sexta]|uniref:Lipocalin/cytosolic fatty-acid binding domain-containing protein n=1 Tax=Manduca sexta TaxID=7130 RepID=A0A922CQ58_MANSE|nr:hypothetical protein O3G_MSEX009140 [Manduca sexta]